ncbi:hypothetical protein BASA50_003977 [Batrachochytrium salamandrivorans]|uniref:Stabilizer of axonemal microtubules 2 n=1 Tax=Batrachochytrium salamandrivorans TaxID=1357716 RepID=A0ABQ8FGV7_9FUNG|nr:hypothetical protein BASA60_009569 [Batrachochytrium salamandrivorans]KAH6567720.1 hypothetical protein BASA62_005935 [Batrachochytrium salamandrivorans]KAH6588742.1 hypothetical protein BASA61_005835 [Batrachochytrium salamandrivorans]KAH6598096.1 hypothetical protein BASA50_003977 [Batrachochytrium salamandrivorans]KAH9249004.1 hypothetical protein BASA81_013300 [Batrachochytrium salamandrivorans]
MAFTEQAKACSSKPKVSIIKSSQSSSNHLTNSKSCICTVCTCGHHKLCKPVKTTDAPLEGCTEYSDNFKHYTVKVRRGLPAPQELSVGGEFYGSTENHEKFVPYAISSRHKIKKEVYSPNEAVFDSMTTHQQDYRAWPGVTPPKRKENEPWVSTSGKFDGSTTTKSNYIEYALPPHYVRHQQPYVKSDTRFEGLSTQSEDFKSWAVTEIPTRRKPAAKPAITEENRDFKSTSATSFVGHHVKRELVRAPQIRTTDSKGKFETISTAKEAYKVWEIPPRPQRHKVEYTPSSAGFDGTTTYNNTFHPKTVERYIHSTPSYVPNKSKFEGSSTNKTDYLPTGPIVRCKDFRPRNIYAPTADDRDFVSTTRDEHNFKPLSGCPATEWVKSGVSCQKDGHVRISPKAVSS